MAPDRVISTVDRDAGHGHRSRRDRYHGYKLHLAVDADSDLLTAAEASLATTHDSVVLPRLLASDPVTVAEVLGDSHCGAAQSRRDLASQGIELVAPAPPSTAPKGMFSKDDFVVESAGDSAAPSRRPPGHHSADRGVGAGTGPLRRPVRWLPPHGAAHDLAPPPRRGDHRQ